MTPDRTTIAAILELEAIRKRIDQLLAMLYASQEPEARVERKGKRVSFRERFNEGRVTK